MFWTFCDLNSYNIEKTPFSYIVFEVPDILYLDSNGVADLFHYTFGFCPFSSCCDCCSEDYSIECAMNYPFYLHNSDPYGKLLYRRFSISEVLDILLEYHPVLGKRHRNTIMLFAQDFDCSGYHEAAVEEAYPLKMVNGKWENTYFVPTANDRTSFEPQSLYILTVESIRKSLQDIAFLDSAWESMMQQSEDMIHDVLFA